MIIEPFFEVNINLHSLPFIQSIEISIQLTNASGVATFDTIYPG